MQGPGVTLCILKKNKFSNMYKHMKNYKLIALLSIVVSFYIQAQETDNEIIGKYDPSTQERLLIQSDISYDGPRTNIHNWWVTTTPGTFFTQNK